MVKVVGGRNAEEARPPSNHTKQRGLQVPKHATHSSFHVCSPLVQSDFQSRLPDRTARRVFVNGSSQSFVLEMAQVGSVAQPQSWCKY